MTMDESKLVKLMRNVSPTALHVCASNLDSLISALNAGDIDVT